MLLHTNITRLALSLCLVWGTASAQGASQQKTVTKPAAQSAVGIGVSPEAISTAVAPQVSCSGGEVAVSASNSTLASVLKAVAHCAGAIVHMPADIGETRVAGRYGPVAPMSLIASLLNGSADYVILGSRSNPGRVQMVIVKPHSTAPVSAQPRTAASAAPVQKTFIDEEGTERLLSGLTAEEADLTPEELAQKFEAARQEQRRLDELNQQPH